MWPVAVVFMKQTATKRGLNINKFDPCRYVLFSRLKKKITHKLYLIISWISAPEIVFICLMQFKKGASKLNRNIGLYVVG